MTAEQLALVSAAVAAVSAVGSVASAVVSSRNGKRQQESAREIARLNLIAPMREAWIDQLRDKVANFITKCAQLNLRRPTEHDSDTFALLLLRHEIHLMLNPADESHQKLHEAMKKMVNIAQKTMPNDPKIGESVDQTTALAHHVLAAEWRRAKAGE